MSKSMKALVLAGVLSIAAVSSAQASDGPGNIGDGNGRSHASAAPVCGDQCPVLATDGPPGSVGDKNGRSMASNTGGKWHPILAGGKPTGMDFHASAAPACDTHRCPVLADDSPPIGINDGNGYSSAALSQGGAEFLVASIRGGSTGDF